MLGFRLLRVSSPLLAHVPHRMAPSLLLGGSHVRTYAKATELTLPALSPTMEEGVIVQWNKKEGESFKAGDVLFQLQTDKSVLDVEAPDDGILAKIVVQANNPPLAVNSTVAYLASKGDDLSKLEYPAPKTKGAEKKPEKKQEKQEEKQPPKQQAQPEKQEKAQPKQEKKEEHKKEDTHHSDEFMFPSVRRLLTENHLELSQVKATGPQGRVLKGDVLNAIKNKGDLLPPSTKSEKPTDSSQQATPKPTTKPQTSAQSYEDIPNNNIRQVIAKRLTESKTTIPHLYVNAECNIDQLLAMRTRLNNEQKVKLSVNDFILKAAALTLRDLPAANATWTNSAIRQLKDVDVSVAVATDKGLITPIIKNTDKKGLATIATELKDLAARARTGSLKPQEFQGGSFSVSNLGMYGISHFIAVINPPQAAILAVGAGRQEIRLKSSLSSPKIDLDSLPLAAPPSRTSSPSSSASSSSPLPLPSHEKVVVNVVDVTLSCDNRVIDEALAGQFLERFQKYLSTPEMLVL
eukprot:Phypoly_transcript_07302.p1 GENE.Phypoly_transcript_07302~~Phypoly_transcript_07302.p1  ORF type:complete len:520 (-),score=122.66 Phypoly_transcript_07302:31-1590(-)